MDHKKTARRELVSSIKRIVDSFGLRAQTMLTFKSLLQKFRSSLEWIRPPRDDLAEESTTEVQQEMELTRGVVEPHDDPEIMRSLLP